MGLVEVLHQLTPRARSPRLQWMRWALAAFVSTSGREGALSPPPFPAIEAQILLQSCSGWAVRPCRKASPPSQDSTQQHLAAFFTAVVSKSSSFRRAATARNFLIAEFPETPPNPPSAVVELGAGAVPLILGFGFSSEGEGGKMLSPAASPGRPGVGVGGAPPCQRWARKGMDPKEELGAGGTKGCFSERCRRSGVACGVWGHRRPLSEVREEEPSSL